MTDEMETPFDNLDSARQYVRLLRDALREAQGDVDEDIRVARKEGAQRRLEALQLARYKLDKLEDHLTRSGVILNDLRMLRRLLLGESSVDPVQTTSAE